MLGDYLYKPPNLYLGLHGYVLGCVHLCTCIYVCGCLNIVFQVFRCNYLYMKHLDLVSKLNINVVLKRNYERKLSSNTGHFEMQLNFLIERTSLVVCYWIHSP